MAMSPAATQTPRTTGPGDADKSYVDWPAIIGGAFVAVAISFVLITFGSGIGLSMASAEPGEGVSLRWITIAAGIWFVWVAISSFAAGGYLAGRMRRPIGDAADEVETRDGIHGILVWGLGAVVGTLLAASGVTGVVGAVAPIAGAAADTAETVMEDEIDYYVGRMLRSGDGAVVTDSAVRTEVATVLERSMAEGEVASDDRDYLVQVVANQTGADQAAAQEQVDQVIGNAEAARETAVDAIEQARTAGIVSSFLIAATLLISAVAAYFTATYGGQHRDKRIAFRTLGRR